MIQKSDLITALLANSKHPVIVTPNSVPTTDMELYEFYKELATDSDFKELYAKWVDGGRKEVGIPKATRRCLWIHTIPINPTLEPKYVHTTSGDLLTIVTERDGKAPEEDYHELITLMLDRWQPEDTKDCTPPVHPTPVKRADLEAPGVVGDTMTALYDRWLQRGCKDSDVPTWSLRCLWVFTFNKEFNDKETHAV